MKSKINDVGKLLRGMKIFSCRVMEIHEKRKLCEEVAGPTALYGIETWSMAVVKKETFNVIEMRYQECEWIMRNF